MHPSLVSGFVTAAQLLSPNPYTFPCIVCGNALTLTIKHSPEFYCCLSSIWFHQTFSNRPSPSFRVFFWPHFFIKVDGSQLSFHVLIVFWTVLNPVLVVSAIPLDVFSSWCTPMIWPFSNTQTSFPWRCDVNFYMVVHLIRSNSLNQLGLIPMCLIKSRWWLFCLPGSVKKLQLIIVHCKD